MLFMLAAMLTLYQMERSPFCDKVRRILRYKNIPFEVQEVSPVLGRAYSPTGKLPAIEIDGQRIHDSTEIAHFLERRFPEPALIPASAEERALCHMLEDWADESLYYYEMALHFSLRDNTARRLEQLLEQEPPLQKALLKRLFPTLLRIMLWAQGIGRRAPQRLLDDVRRHMDALEDKLGNGPFLLGKALTLADVAVAVQLDAMCETPEARALCDEHPRVSAWLSRVRQKTCG